MSQILYTQQIRSDRLRDVFGILVIFALASAGAVIASGAVAPGARFALLGLSSILFALGIRGIWFYFQRVSYSLVVSNETIVWGWVHKPKSKKNARIADIKQADWLDGKSNAKILLHLTTGEELHLFASSKSDLRKMFENHFPHIEIV